MQKLHAVCLDPATGQCRPAAQVRVFRAYTHNLADLYADDEVVRIANPQMADMAGRVAFKVIDGDYDLEVSGPGFTPYKLTGVQAADKDNYVTKEDFEAGGGGGGEGDFVTVGMLTYVDAKLEFGAKGDGATDDWANIQAAINAGRGPVYLRPGTYRVSQPITLLENSTIIGSGVGSAIITPLSDTVSAFAADGIDSGVIENLSVNSPVTSGGVAAIRFNNCHWITVQNVFVQGHWSQGIVMQAGTTSRVRDVVVSNCDTALALTLGQTTTSVENFTATLVATGIYLQSVFAIFMENILIHKFQDNAILGNNWIDHLVLVGGSFVNEAAGSGVWFGHEGTPLSQCWFLGVAYTNTGHIFVPAGSQYWLMTNNLVLSVQGLINSPSAIKAWGGVNTLTGTLLGESLGVASVVKLDIGRVRINWQYPAVWIGNSYVLTCTVLSTTATPIIVHVAAVQPAFADVVLLNTAGVFVDGLFLFHAGGTVG